MREEGRKRESERDREGVGGGGKCFLSTSMAIDGGWLGHRCREVEGMGAE